MGCFEADALRVRELYVNDKTRGEGKMCGVTVVRVRYNVVCIIMVGTVGPARKHILSAEFLASAELVCFDLRQMCLPPFVGFKTCCY